SRTQYQLSLEDPDGAELNAWAPRLVGALRTLPELADVSSDQQDQGLGIALAIDRVTASRLGITPQVIGDTLYHAFRQRPLAPMVTQLNQSRVVLEVKPDFRQTPGGLQDIYVRGAAAPPASSAPSGSPGPVPLGAVTRATETTVPLSIARQGQFPAVTL